MKVEVEIPKAEFDIISKIAAKLGLTVQMLVQQEVDANITTISAWVQRAQQ